MSNHQRKATVGRVVTPTVVSSIRRNWLGMGNPSWRPMAITSRSADDLAASLRRTRLALLGLAAVAATVTAGAVWQARENGFQAGQTAAEEHIEQTVGEAYRQGQRDALEAAYTCRGVAI